MRKLVVVVEAPETLREFTQDISEDPRRDEIVVKGVFTNGWVAPSLLRDGVDYFPPSAVRLVTIFRPRG